MESMVKNELKEIMGIKSQPLFTRIYRWEKSMPQYTVGHTEKIALVEDMLDEHPGLFLTGSGYYGIGISDCVRHANEVAGQVMDFLKGPE